MKPLKRIVITGSQGSLGKILQDGFKYSFNLLCLDKIAGNFGSVVLDVAADYEKFKGFLKEGDIVVHLAWDTCEDYPNENIIPENKTMAENVYRAAVEAGVSRVIMASSVHANDYSDIPYGKYMTVESESFPDTPYGVTKNYIEQLGRFYSRKHGLEVICIRFGGVNEKNEIRFNEDPLYDEVLLYKEDFIELLRMCVNAEKVPRKFSVFYAVSNMPRRVHSLDNFLNWYPKLPSKK